MKKLFFLAAVATMTLASCMNDEFIGTENSPTVANTETDAINFGNGFRAVTRAGANDKYGKAAADLLGAKFIVTGVKGDGTWTANQTDVFKSYAVTWTQNTAGKTESNTSDWEYVGVTPQSGVTGVTAQTIKYWDFSATDYNFAAYSVGTGSATGTPITIDVEATANAGAYSLTGARADLTKCYITDMKTVAHANFKEEVVLEFRSLASKVRMALYETVPGYSITDVKFRSVDVAAPASPGNVLTYATSADATLFGTGAFREKGTFTVKFPNIGSDNGTSDHNKAHVDFLPDSDPLLATSNTQGFGNLNYTSTKEGVEGDGSYLQRSSKTPSFAGTGTYYQVMLPNETGVVLEMCVDYTLVATDGSGEVIKVYGAKAFVPAVYTKWLPNYAYTYIFKISDNTNGWTNPNDTDPSGLFPITFDAVVLNDELTGTQTTITTVAEPSITTYQKGHVYSATNSYDKDKDIYVQVMQNGSLVTDLKATNKSYFYKLSADKTEAEVMDALNIRTSGSATTVVGRNGLTLTPITNASPAGTQDYAITAIPGEDGNNITVNSGEAGQLNTGGGAGTYAYVYDYTSTTPTPSDIITCVVLTADPGDWVASDANVYYSDAACTSKVTTAYADGTYYKKYTDLNRTYAVKVIKVE